MPRVIITGPAKRDIKNAHDWWKQNRSAEQANRWYQGVHAEIKTLRQSAERCALAAESDLLAQGIRQLLFGLGAHPTHRIVFTIEANTVVVLRVRHVSQDNLSSNDIRES
jgi:plasmid stabilization system protein ParE